MVCARMPVLIYEMLLIGCPSLFTVYGFKREVSAVSLVTEYSNSSSVEVVSCTYHLETTTIMQPRKHAEEARMHLWSFEGGPRPLLPLSWKLLVKPDIWYDKQLLKCLPVVQLLVVTALCSPSYTE